MAAKKSGDWDCSCGATNFQRRDKCHMCNRKKEFHSSVKRANDWACASCPGQLNFASRKECRSCGKPRQEEVKMRPGDWKCGNVGCTQINFGNRVVCRQCGCPNQSSVDEATLKKIQEAEERALQAEDKLKCVICTVASKEVRLAPCEHAGFCHNCVKDLERCPMCRGHIDRVVRVFDA